MKPGFIILFICIYFQSAYAQMNILDNAETQQKIESCLHSIYNYDFSKAEKEQSDLVIILPDHPVCSFLEGLIIYWENMPLLPEDPQTDQFLSSMERSVRQAKALLKDNPHSMEGLFFDLHARAFMVMFWADNGKPAKALKDIDNLYRRTMQGKGMKENFNEFYFSSGLYSYYIEAYVEKHPVYKPIALLFRKGDKERGLEELQYAIDSTTYIKVEALLFMSLLQLNYEKKKDQALEYAAVLYNNYPENTYYIGHYVMILLYQNEFELAKAILQGLVQKEEKFSRMIHTIMQGFVLENDLNNLSEAKRNYLTGIEKANEFGPFADIYKSIAYAGLSRISLKKGNIKLSKKYGRKSESLSKYEFILNYEQKP